MRGHSDVYLTCDECDALWALEEFQPDDHGRGLKNFAAYLEANGATHPDDVTWLDADHPFGTDPPPWRPRRLPPPA
jgi:hypothetical protein